jgi:hypothetical protein
LVNKLSSEKALTFIFLIIICFVVGFVYLNSLKAPFTLDDFPKIVENPDIQKLSNLKSRLIYPYEESNRTFNRNSPLRPLTSLTFALNYHFNGLNPQGYHLFDIVLHMFTAVLVFFFTRMLLRVATGEKSLNVPLIATCIFALHPVNTVAVDYIYNRSDQLMPSMF